MRGGAPSARAAPPSSDELAIHGDHVIERIRSAPSVWHEGA